MLLPIRWPAANAAKHYLLAVALRIAKLVIYILTTDPVQWVWEHSSTPCNNFVGFLEIIALPLILSIYLSLVFPLFVFILLCGNNVINRKNQTNVSNEMITNLAQYNMHLFQFKPSQTYCLASEHLIWTINYPHTHKKKRNTHMLPSTRWAPKHLKYNEMLESVGNFAPVAFLAGTFCGIQFRWFVCLLSAL